MEQPDTPRAIHPLPYDDLYPMNEELVVLIQRVFIALALGFLIGLEREYAKRVLDKEEQFAGVRTYTFIALFGFLCAHLAQQYGDWVFVAGLSGMIALIIATYVMSAKAGSYGITTELSGILAFVIGAVVFQGEVLYAVIVTVIITTLLSLKVKLHSFIVTLTPQEIRAFIQFVIISAVILPFLPNGPMGPNGVWNLHQIWVMVILVTGISLTGYLLAKLFGSSNGTLLAGIIGGLVSSTAVTLTRTSKGSTTRCCGEHHRGDRGALPPHLVGDLDHRSGTGHPIDRTHRVHHAHFVRYRLFHPSQRRQGNNGCRTDDEPVELHRCHPVRRGLHGRALADGSGLNPPERPRGVRGQLGLRCHRHGCDHVIHRAQHGHLRGHEERGRGAVGDAFEHGDEVHDRGLLRG